MAFADEPDETIMQLYFERFGDVGNSRQMPDEVLRRLPELMAAALERGTPLTDEELQIGDIPPNAMG